MLKANLAISHLYFDSAFLTYLGCLVQVIGWMEGLTKWISLTRQRFCRLGLIWFWKVMVRWCWVGLHSHPRLFCSWLGCASGYVCVAWCSGGSPEQFRLVFQLHPFLDKKTQLLLLCSYLSLTIVMCCTWDSLWRRHRNCNWARMPSFKYLQV